MGTNSYEKLMAFKKIAEEFQEVTNGSLIYELNTTGGKDTIGIICPCCKQGYFYYDDKIPKKCCGISFVREG